MSLAPVGLENRTAALFYLYPCSAPCFTRLSTKIPRIGFLLAAILHRGSSGFREVALGYMKEEHVRYRYAEGNNDRLPALAAELVRLKVDIVVSGGPAVTRPLKEATNTIPIVMAFDDDPVGNGFVASLARPGGNITGLATLAPELSGKQLELLKEIIPKLSRVAVLWTSTQPGTAKAKGD
jgi:putative ABC transport system substrate-binding protein